MEARREFTERSSEVKGYQTRRKCLMLGIARVRNDNKCSQKYSQRRDYEFFMPC